MATRRQANQLYYWPGMARHIADVIDRCELCQTVRPTQPPSELKDRGDPGEAMAAVAVDLFDFQGRKYVAAIHRHSRYIFARKLPNQSTSSLLSILHDWFITNGMPRSIETDGGPQFRDEFAQYCRKWAIKHEISSVSHHQSNGLAEAGVKIAKLLLSKSSEWNDFLYRLARRNATPSPDGRGTPSTLFYGRDLRFDLPSIRPRATQPKRKPRVGPARSYMRKEKTFCINERVRIQSPLDKRWNTSGIITAVRPNGRSYVIKMQNGRQTIRNVRYIKAMTHIPVKNSEPNTGNDVLSHNLRSRLVQFKYK